MKTRTKGWLICSCLIGCFSLSTARAVDFIMKDQDGVFQFNCINACGPVRVRATGKCEFMVQSAYYRGKVKACSAEIAALQACGELPFERPVREDLLDPACTH